MSIFSPTRIKALSVNDRSEVATNVVVATSVVLPCEVGKDLVITLVNANAATDYDGAKLAILGTSLSKASGNWMSSNAIGYIASEKTGNEIALKKGTTVITIPAAVVEPMSSITLVVTGSATSPLSAYTSWSDIVSTVWKTVDVLHPFYRLNVTDKNWKITVIPKGVDASNTVKISATSNMVYWSEKLFTKEFLRPVANYIDITKPTIFYLNDIYALPVLSISTLCTGTASAAVLVEATNQAQDVSEFYTRLFETAASIGSAYFYTPDVLAKYVLVRITATLTGGGTGSVTFIPRSSDGVDLPLVFSEFGSYAKSNTATFLTSATRYFYLPRTVDIDRVHASCSISGAGNTVLVAFANLKSDLTVKDAVADTAPYFKGDGFEVRLQAASVAAFSNYENWSATVSSAGLLTISNGASSQSISLTAMPGWKTGDIVGAMGFIPYKQGGPTATLYSRETSTRLCFFTRLGNTYHNYPATAADDSTVAGMVDFDLSAIYEPVYRVSDNLFVSSERIPSTNASLTTEEKKLYRYQPGLPAWNYAQHSANIGGVKADASAYGGGGLPAVLDKNGVKHIRMVVPFEHGTNPQNAACPFSMYGYLSNPFSVKPKCTTYVSYNGINAAKNVVVGTTDGGRTWVVLHELGCNSRTSSYGNNFDYSLIGAYTSGALSVVRRNYNYPTLLVKDPVSCFQYGAPFTVASIATTSGKAIITTDAAHGLAEGDLICFKKNNAGLYDFLENIVTVANAATFASNSAGDGRFYRVGAVTSTTFDLRQNYNGVDEKVGTHHIHSGNPAKDGVVVCCGEKYPQGWLMFIRIPEIDDFAFFNIYTHRITTPFIYRLNSAELGMQRAVGMIWTDDANQTLLFASDEAFITDRTVTIPGRDAAAVPTRNTAGVFRAKLADIDDMQLATVACEMEEASLGIVGTQNMFAVLGMSRKVYLSLDAVKWTSFPLIASYVGESSGAIYLRSGTNVYKVTKL